MTAPSDRAANEQAHSERLLQLQLDYCKILNHTFTSRAPKLPAAAACILCAALRLWADAGAEYGIGRSLRLEALEALAALLHSNVGQLSTPERAATLALLLSTAQVHSTLVIAW